MSKLSRRAYRLLSVVGCKVGTAKYQQSLPAIRDPMTSASRHTLTSRHDEGPPSAGPSCEASVPTESLRPASAGASDVVSHLTIGVLAGLEDDGHSERNPQGCQTAVSDAAGRPPTSNTGVVNGNSCSDEIYGWDWSSTTHDGHDLVVNDLVDALGAVTVVPGTGLQGWSTSVKAFDRDGYALGSCLLYTSPSPRDGLLSRMPSSA